MARRQRVPYRVRLSPEVAALVETIAENLVIKPHHVLEDLVEDTYRSKEWSSALQRAVKDKLGHEESESRVPRTEAVGGTETPLETFRRERNLKRFRADREGGAF